MYGPYVEGGINYGFANNSFFTPNRNPGQHEDPPTLSSIGVFVNARGIEDLLVGVGFNYVSTGERALQHVERLLGLLRPTRRGSSPSSTWSEAAVREAGRRVREVAFREVLQHPCPYNDRCSAPVSASCIYSEASRYLF